jgi:hypothetical protein
MEKKQNAVVWKWNTKNYFLKGMENMYDFNVKIK